MDDSQYPDLSLLVGKRVRLRGTSDETGSATEEFGYIIHAWIEEELRATDCYVTFFGEAWPEIGVKPVKKPYVLRYLLSSLEEC